jgi:nitroreductase
VELTEALAQRRSIRAYQQKTVDPEVIREIFTQAQQAPSNCNSQPWHVSVVSGEARDRLETALIERVSHGQKPVSAFKPYDIGFVGDFKERQVSCAVELWNAVGIKREDREARTELFLDNWRFFGAPHVAFISMPLNMGEGNALDVGIYLQTLMLLMTDHGLGCCPQGALALFPEPVFEIAQVPENYGLLCGVSFGYADMDADKNKLKMPRLDVDESVIFIG